MCIFHKGFLWKFRNSFKAEYHKTFYLIFSWFCCVCAHSWPRKEGDGIQNRHHKCTSEQSQTQQPCLLTCKGRRLQATFWQYINIARQMITAGYKTYGDHCCIRFKKMKVMILKTENGNESSAAHRNYIPVADLEIFYLEYKMEVFFSTFLPRFSQNSLKNTLAPGTPLTCLDHWTVE